MALTTVATKVVNKISTVPGEIPTLGPSFDYTDGTWSVTDIYEGEIFMNTADQKVYTILDGVVIDITGGAGSPSDLETTLGVGNTTGPNWIEVEPNYGLESTDGSGVTQTVRLSPAGVGSAIDINCIDTTNSNTNGIALRTNSVELFSDGPTLANSYIFMNADYTSLDVSDGVDITDTILIDPQGTGNGTGIFSQNSSTGAIGGIGVNPLMAALGADDGAGNGSNFNIEPNKISQEVNTPTGNSTITSEGNSIFLETNDGADIIDTIGIDPLGSGVGTGIFSNNSATGDSSLFQTAPTRADIISLDGSNYTAISVQKNNIEMSSADVRILMIDNTIEESFDSTSTPSESIKTGKSFQTSNATPIVLNTFIPNIRKVYQVEAIVRGIKTDWTKAITAKINASFRVNALGVVTSFGTPNIILDTEFSTADATLTTDGTNILVTITGEAATSINWSSTLLSSIA